MVTLHLYTYQGDEYILPATIAAANAACPKARIVCIDESLKPCHPETRMTAEKLGVEWRVSAWWRNRNLNGQAAIMGILGEMFETYCNIKLRKGSEIADSSVYMKMDCDTLLRDSAWIDEFETDPTLGVTGFDDRGALYGCCYALKGWLLLELIMRFNRCPVGNHSQEDLFIGSRARDIAGGDGFRHLPMWYPVNDTEGPNGPEGIMTAYAWSGYPNNLDKYEQFSVITMGNPRGPELGQDKVIEVMRALKSRRPTSETTSETTNTHEDVQSF